MDASGPRGLLRSCEKLEDFRMDRTRRHELSDMVAIAVLGVTCGAESWTDIATFGRAKRKLLETFLKLPGGIPSDDTFGRVFATVSPRRSSSASSPESATAEAADVPQGRLRWPRSSRTPHRALRELGYGETLRDVGRAMPQGQTAFGGR